MNIVQRIIIGLGAMGIIAVGGIGPLQTPATNTPIVTTEEADDTVTATLSEAVEGDDVFDTVFDNKNEATESRIDSGS